MNHLNQINWFTRLDNQIDFIWVQEWVDNCDNYETI